MSPPLSKSSGLTLCSKHIGSSKPDTGQDRKTKTVLVTRGWGKSLDEARWHTAIGITQMFPHTVYICWGIIPKLCGVISGIAPYYFRTGFLMAASPTYTGLPPHLFGSEHLTVLWPLLVTLQAHMSTALTCFVEKLVCSWAVPNAFPTSRYIIRKPIVVSFQKFKCFLLWRRWYDVNPSYHVHFHWTFHLV